MTAPTAPSRTRRSRVLCIGLDSAASSIDHCLAQQPLHVDNLFAAMGALAASGATEPIETALVSSRIVAAASSDSVAALREIDPALRLVLVRDAADAAALADPPNGLFESALSMPIDAEKLQHALGNGSDRSPAYPGSPSRVIMENQQQSSTHPAAQPNQKPIPGSESPVPVVPLLDLQQSTQSNEPVTAEHTGDDDETLGDTDLVKSIITHDGRLRSLAMRLIAQQTGWRDITLHPQQQFIEGAAAAVTFHDHAFGMLSSPSADARALRPWADWLGHWLALDQSHRLNRLLAYRDELTGAWNRRFFTDFLVEALRRARQLRLPVTVMVFDLDDFKQYNDRFGHEAGDEILIETVRLMESVIRRCDRVCRIGGDEFVVIFADLEGPRAAGSAHPDAVGEIAKRFQKQICSMQFPKLGTEAPGSLTISGGLSTFPWDGDTPDELLRLADQRALRSKRAGKNVITFGPEQ